MSTILCGTRLGITVLGMSDTVGQRAKRRRIELGLSQEKLAHLADVSSSVIARMEQGKQDPLVPTLEAIASGLGWTLAQLLGTAESDHGQSMPASLNSFLEANAQTMRVTDEERAWLARPFPCGRDIGDDEWWMAQLVAYRQQLRLYASSEKRADVKLGTIAR